MRFCPKINRHLFSPNYSSRNTKSLDKNILQDLLRGPL
jgi:hypothetical protein